MNVDTIHHLEQQAAAAVAAGDWGEGARLAGEADRLDRAQPRPTLAEAALDHASRGLRVFPLQPNSKIPYPGSHGFEDATTDPGQIRRWWELAPQSNIGIATGHLVDVVDVDGPAGVESWVRELWNDLPPILARAKTVRPGGHHLYIAAIDGAKNRAKMLPGVDYRGLGGYVVSPPSIVDGKRYRFVPAVTAA